MLQNKAAKRGFLGARQLADINNLANIALPPGTTLTVHGGGGVVIVAMCGARRAAALRFQPVALVNLRASRPSRHPATTSPGLCGR